MPVRNDQGGILGDHEGDQGEVEEDLTLVAAASPDSGDGGTIPIDVNPGAVASNMGTPGGGPGNRLPAKAEHRHGRQGAATGLHGWPRRDG